MQGILLGKINPVQQTTGTPKLSALNEARKRLRSMYTPMYTPNLSDLNKAPNLSALNKARNRLRKMYKRSPGQGGSRKNRKYIKRKTCKHNTKKHRTKKHTYRV